MNQIYDPNIHKKSIEETVQSIRFKALVYSEIIDIVALANELGFQVVEVAENKPKGLCSFILVDLNKPKIKGFEQNKVIGINESHSSKEKRFFVAYELGRYYLSGKPNLTFANRQGFDETPEQQYSATYFAHCLLMPKNTFLDSLQKTQKITNNLEETIKFLSEYFKVPEYNIRQRMMETLED